jgi:hypothetical protein
LLFWLGMTTKLDTTVVFATYVLLGAGCAIDDRLVQTGIDAGGVIDGSKRAADASTNACSGKTVVAPSNGATVAFAGDAQIRPYGPSTTPTSYSQAGGILNIQEAQDAGSAPAYPGLTLFFSGPCVDASAFSGVEFTLEGTLSGCTMQYATAFTEDAYNGGNNIGSCTDSLCYEPQTDLLPTPTATVVQIPWAVTLESIPGHPVANPDDPASITGLEWQFTVPQATDAGTNTCVANVNISNLEFYR